MGLEHNRTPAPLSEVDSPAAYTVVVADDDPSVRHFLTALVGSEPSLKLVGSAANATGAVEICERQRPDVALVDVRMPGGGAAATRQILAQSPHTRVVAFSGYSDRATVLEMVAAGASGYLVKGCSEREIVETVLRTGWGEANPATETTAAVILDVSAEVRVQERELREQQRRRERIESVIESRAVSMVFQAIAQLNTGRVVGAEALARFHGEPSRGPDWWFGEARAVGLVVELELITLALALESLRELPSGVGVAINLSPETAASSALTDGFADVPGERVTIEITEHARVADYGELTAALSGLRERGVKLAVDDAGAGFASLQHILRLAPDVIKLDVGLTRDIDSDRARRALASALIAFARETGAVIIAEGIETRAELEALRSLGVSFGQGFYVAKPTPLTTAWPTLTSLSDSHD